MKVPAVCLHREHPGSGGGTAPVRAAHHWEEKEENASGLGIARPLTANYMLHSKALRLQELQSVGLVLPCGWEQAALCVCRVCGAPAPLSGIVSLSGLHFIYEN